MQTWRTHLGIMVTLDGIADEHLANLVQYLHHYKFPRTVLREVFAEVKRRGLTKEFLARAPIPYKDGVGNWIVWDYETGRQKILGRYAR